MLDLFATCPKGLEYLLRDELAELGAIDAHEALSGVYFRGELEIAYRACLWSRLASRVLLTLDEFDVADADALYAGMQAIDWSTHLAADGSFAIDAVGTTPALRHSHFTALRAKDAVVDQFRERHGARPDVDKAEPSLRIHLRLRRDRASVAIDLSGTPLHRRGWRVGQGEAPLKENLACAMLIRAGWPAIHRDGGALVDPMCGAGTLLVEGAAMAADIAPGLKRAYFGFIGWRQHDAGLWQRLHDEASMRAERGLRTLAPVFFGYDVDAAALGAARLNAQASGFAGFVHLARQSVEHLQRAESLTRPGLVICNPPYGERIGRDENLAALYRALGDRLRDEFSDWRAAVIVADAELGHAIGLRASRRYVLFNGALECALLIFDMGQAAEARARVIKPLGPGAQSVANRIAKTQRHQRKRLQREGISCYRAYDADLPEYAAAIDVYSALGRETADGSVDASAAGTWLHVQEYAAPAEIPVDVARSRLADLVHAAGDVFETPRERIAIKTRLRGKGGGKYGRFGERREFLIVEEGGLRFRVNLFDYLDTGLFLDHRPVRERLREECADARFLNLFCYTASASIYAAAGRARSTTSVDLSATYLEWASRNFTSNGLGGPRHQIVQADVIEWLCHDRGEYDVIFVDPPTFSNSKRAADFDVQRDHADLLAGCASRLARGGLIVFSNNARRFTLDARVSDDFTVEDWTTATLPFDFARNPRIHRCYALRRRS